MTKTIAVIDGNSLMHRAYHAVQTPMNAPDGTPTNAIFGFCQMLFKFIEVAHPDGIVCAFDRGKPRFRIEALEQYKAQRPPMDDELRQQFAPMESLLKAMNIPVITVEGWEGDDILGTVAARNEERGYQTLLVSGDKDINQLVTDMTHVVSTKKGITDVVIYDPATVKEKYGIEPSQFPDYLGFMGDSSDNIPGVPGIGPKTAQKLLDRFGSMEGVYENLDKLKGKQLENIRDNRDLAFLSRQIATIVTDLDFELDVDSVEWPSFDADTVAAAFDALQLKSPYRRLLAVTGSEGSAAKSAAPLFEVREPLPSDQAKRLIDGAIERNELLAVALDRSDQDSLFSVEMLLAVSCSEGVVVVQGNEALDLLTLVVREGKWAALDAKAVIHALYPIDSSEPSRLSDGEVLAADVFDVSLAAYVIDSTAGKYPLEMLAETYLEAGLPVEKDGYDRVLSEAEAVRSLKSVLESRLENDGIASVYADIDAPLIGVLAIMERNGAPIDLQELETLGQETQTRIDEFRKRIYELAGEEFNADSPMQLGQILFEKLGLPHGKKTTRGYSTDAKALKKLVDYHELPGVVLQYRELAKIKSTYIDALPQIAKKFGDCRVHTSFNETVTATGRLSSSDPNLQNIPVRTDFGRQIRACFGAGGDDRLFLSADYSQIELRLLAHLSGDTSLIASFKSGADFHAATAARVFGVPVDGVTPQMRSRAKAVNFGIVYGQQAFGLAQNLGIPMTEARDMIDRYFEVHPGVRTYLDQTVEIAKEKGYAETMFGRRRYIPELAMRNAMQRGFGERTAMNHPMQGSAADIIKLAMIEVQKRLLEEGYRARLLIQVHDELDFSVPIDEVESLSSLVKDVMEGVVEMQVPLIADVSSGKTWAEAH